jgi:hypothetical protein
MNGLMLESKMVCFSLDSDEQVSQTRLILTALREDFNPMSDYQLSQLMKAGVS